MKKLPAEVISSLLAVSTIFISMPPYNLPPWAVFISWAGTFAMGGPTSVNLKRIWPVMPLGSLTAMLIVLLFENASKHYTGQSFLIVQCIILFCLNGLMMSVARFIPALSFIPGMFFGFASYFATVFGGFGPIPHDPFAAFIAVVIMNALGPVYAWITANFSNHKH